MRGVVAVILGLVCLSGPTLVNAQDPRFSSKLAPYVASPVRVVDLMLDIAKVKPGETVIDRGCGDGSPLESIRARASRVTRSICTKCPRLSSSRPRRCIGI